MNNQIFIDALNEYRNNELNEEQLFKKFHIFKNNGIIPDENVLLNNFSLVYDTRILSFFLFNFNLKISEKLICECLFITPICSDNKLFQYLISSLSKRIQYLKQSQNIIFGKSKGILLEESDFRYSLDFTFLKETCDVNFSIKSLLRVLVYNIVSFHQDLEYLFLLINKLNCLDYVKDLLKNNTYYTELLDSKY